MSSPRAVLRSLLTIPAGKRSKWLVLAVWILLAGGAGTVGGRLTSVETNDAVTYLPGDAESTRAAQIESTNFGDQQQSPAVVVFVRDSGITTADSMVIEQDRQLLAKYAVGLVGAAVHSRDGKAVLVVLPMASGFQVVDSVKHVRQLLMADDPPGLVVKVTGPAASGADIGGAFSGTNLSLALAALAVVAVLLLITYRSPILWLIPLLSVGVASQFASGIVFLLAKFLGLLVSGLSGSILAVLVLGVGTDYALLLLARYREELRRHPDRHAAMAEALRRTIGPILASAATVTLAMLCLLVAEMNSTRGLGPVTAIGVVAAFVAIMTLMPALLVVLGRWVFWPFVPRYDPRKTDAQASGHQVWSRIAKLVSRAPRALWMATALGLVLLAVNAINLRTGLTQQNMFTNTPESVVGQQLLSAHYPSGSSDSATVLVRASLTPAVVNALQRSRDVAFISTPQASGDWVRIEVAMTAPAGSSQAGQAVVRIRAALHGISNTQALVGGPAAITLDTNTAFARDEEVAIPLVLVAVLLVLILLLRALVAPLVLLASVVLTYLSALGAAGLVFHVLGRPNVDQSLLLYGFIFLVALGVDYTIFLMTRVREEVGHAGHAKGVLTALVATGGVITSAGTVLAGTFAVLGVLPIVSIVQLGLLVAIGVALDTFVVRTLLVPALALEIGPSMWWPSRLARQSGPERPLVHEGLPTVADVHSRP
jgi:RND superfamily putative drug exporter